LRVKIFSISLPAPFSVLFIRDKIILPTIKSKIGYLVKG
jgi:hypothetical protein